MFSNGLIACLIFMGIGTMLDINFLLAKPLQSMFLALCAELGTFAVVPIAFAMGLSPNDSASIAMVGGADGPMVLFASLNLSKSIFVPITVVAYLYLGLTYGGYPYLVRAMVPKRLRAIKMQPPRKRPNSTPHHQNLAGRGHVRDSLPALSRGRSALLLALHRHRHQGIRTQTRLRLHQRADALRLDLLSGNPAGDSLRRTYAARPHGAQTPRAGHPSPC